MPVDIKDYDIPEDYTVQHLYQDDEFIKDRDPKKTYQHTASIKIPLSLATGLFLLQRGNVDASAVNITAPSSTTANDSATATAPVISAPDEGTADFQIVISYNDETVYGQIGVIRLQDKHGQIGIGNFTPHSTTLSKIAVATTIVVPANASVTALSTDVPNKVTTHHVYGVPNVKFNSLALSGSGGPIDVEFANTDSGAYSTSDGEIKGNFRSSDSLSLSTSNGPVDVKVELDSSGDSVSLAVNNSDGSIGASVSLFSQAADGKGGNFSVSGSTTNDSLSFEFPTAPISSKLGLSLTNSKGRAYAHLHPTFEGSIALNDSGVKPVVKDLKPDDPTGQGRNRTLNITETDDSANGKVFWGTDKGTGNVSIQTDGAELLLEL